MSKKLQEDKSSILNSREHLFTILTATDLPLALHD